MGKKKIKNIKQSEFMKGNQYAKGAVRLKAEKHHSWKGNKVGYWGVHRWLRQTFGPAREYNCHYCTKHALDWANKDHKYSRNKKDYFPLCRSCHLKYDFTLERKNKMSKSMKKTLCEKK